MLKSNWFKWSKWVEYMATHYTHLKAIPLYLGLPSEICTFASIFWVITYITIIYGLFRSEHPVTWISISRGDHHGFEDPDSILSAPSSFWSKWGTGGGDGHTGLCFSANGNPTYEGGSKWTTNGRTWTTPAAATDVKLNLKRALCVFELQCACALIFQGSQRMDEPMQNTWS